MNSSCCGKSLLSSTFTKMLRFWTIAMVLSGFLIDTYTQAAKLDEAICSPRPVVVAIDTPSHKYRPYQVVLHRCHGTCGDKPPTVKRCFATSSVEVPLSVHLVEENRMTTIYVKNVTACGCGCNTECNGIQDESSCRCKCIDGVDCQPQPPALPPTVGASGRTGENTIPLPYMIGMALVAFFAVFVLAFDALLCVKKRGFMYSLKHTCKGEPTKKELITTTRNGSVITTTV